MNSLENCRKEQCSNYKTIVSTDFGGLITPNQLKNSHKLSAASSSSYKEVGVTYGAEENQNQSRR